MLFERKDKSPDVKDFTGISHMEVDEDDLQDNQPETLTRREPPVFRAGMHYTDESSNIERKREKQVENVNAFIGKGSEFVGKLSFEGTIKVDGKIEGEIQTSGKLLVGDSALINAEIKVGSIEISGEVRGNIEAREMIELKTPGRLYGNIVTPCLIVEKGVVFQGHCTMDPDKKPA
jgi:cytoskeletal protein CcmA (bactofilin family)